MLVTSNQLFVTFALFLLFSFTEISQGRKKQPRNVIGDVLKSFKEQKLRNKRADAPTTFSPTANGTTPTTLSPTTNGTQPTIDQGNVECGRRKAGTRIVEGTDATPGSWPWQVILDYKEHEGPHWCGGSILTPYWIVTAAHCFDNRDNPEDFIVTAGEHDVHEKEGYEQLIPIDKIIKHPDYDSYSFDYDVALVKLKNPIKFSINVRPVCLPTTDFAPGTNCYITGWGDTTEGGNESQILQQAEVPLVSREICQKAYDDILMTITERMRCAGYTEGGIDACEGDSGGPLVCPRNNKWYLMGIISFGDGCGRMDSYGVYSDMLELESWVQENIN
ncbi:serine protease 1-like isoform X3 [Oculina patagonica]